MSTTVLGDWGTTHLRLWLLEDGHLRDQATGPGIGALDRAPADVLRAALAPWLAESRPQRITLCGMAGARNGLREVAYVDCPAALDDWRAGAARTDFAAIPLRLAAGVCCRSDAGVPDVMRGEEAQLFGAIALAPQLAAGRHWLLLPGTHSKWARLEDGRISGFRTCVTGEMFALLQGSSLLAAGAAAVPGDEDAGFRDGVTRARDDAGLLPSLFEARAAQLRDGRSASWTRGFLSGLLLATEVGQMLRAGAVGGPVTLIGDPQLTGLYEQALGAFGAKARRADGNDCAMAGLRLLDADD
jgi:2-dehydro-3-deoxygalactonokinase